jgi:hypothetical protein
MWLVRQEHHIQTGLNEVHFFWNDSRFEANGTPSKVKENLPLRSSSGNLAKASDVLIQPISMLPCFSLQALHVIPPLQNLPGTTV